MSNQVTPREFFEFRQEVSDRISEVERTQTSHDLRITAANDKATETRTWFIRIVGVVMTAVVLAVLKATGVI